MMQPSLAAVVAVASALCLASASTITYDSRSALIDGDRVLILSGSVHYPRVPRQDWDSVFSMAKEMGLNTIQTYVFWSFHEHERNNSTFDGQADLVTFVKKAQQAGLYVTVRIGPYACGEYTLGGIPFWMRTLDNISCFRCADPVWEREMARWTGVVVEKLQPLLLPNGGPVIMLQIENEYHGDQNYLNWAVDMARNLTTQVPWNLCHDVDMCSVVNSKEDKALCTINGFWVEQRKNFISQPSQAWLNTQRQNNPKQPFIWTEDQGWFDEWGVAQRVRDPRDQIYGISRFIAYGGSWHNFYMLTGGNNYGLLSGGNVVTAYAPDTVIDYMLLRHQPRFDFYSKFFHMLGSYANELLSNDIPQPVPINGSSHEITGLNMADCASTGTQWKELSISTAKVLDGDFVMLQAQHPSGQNMCLALEQNSPNVGLVKCNTSQHAQHWTVPSKGHVSNRDQASCKKPGRTGLCDMCLDYNPDGTLSVWDCKSSSEPEQANQIWIRDDSKQTLENQGAGTCLSSLKYQDSMVEAHVYGKLALISNFDNTASAEVMYDSQSFFVPNHTVIFYDRSLNQVVFNTSDVNSTQLLSTDRRVQGGSSKAKDWSFYREDVGYGANSLYSPSGPYEQINVTRDQTDYMWYHVDVDFAVKQGDKVQFQAGLGTIVYVYIDGQPQGLASVTSQVGAVDSYESHIGHRASLDRNRSSVVTMSVTASNIAAFDERHASTKSRIEFFCAAMGLTNVGVGPGIVKGIIGNVRVDGKNITSLPWTMSWMMKVEAECGYCPSSHSGRKSINSTISWQPVTKTTPASNATRVWFKALFDVPSSALGQPNQTAYAMSVPSLNKGMIYVNGFNLGRYWLEPGQCSGPCAPPTHGDFCYMHWKGCGKPTQTLYHIPFEHLKQTDNLVVIFEEAANIQARDLSNVEMVVLHNHPSYD